MTPMGVPSLAHIEVLEDGRCPLSTALDVIGGKWRLTALYWLAQRPAGFAELQRLMPGVSHKVLTETLRNLEQDGLVARTAFPTVPPRVQYALTDHGASTSDVIEAVRKWGRAHLAWLDAIAVDVGG